MTETDCLLAPQPTQSPGGQVLRPRSPTAPREGYVVPSPDGRLGLPSRQFDFTSPSPSQSPRASSSSRHRPASSRSQATQPAEADDPSDDEQETDASKRRRSVRAGKQPVQAESSSSKKRKTNAMQNVSVLDQIKSSNLLFAFPDH